MPPVLAALLAFVVSLLRSQAALRLENLALRHQLTVYKQTVARPRLRPSKQNPENLRRNHFAQISSVSPSVLHRMHVIRCQGAKRCAPSKAAVVMTH